MKKQIIQMMGSRIRKILTMAAVTAVSTLICVQAHAADSGAPYGWLDGIREDYTGTYVVGWAKDDATAGPVPVHFYIQVNGEGPFVFLTHGMANLQRADVGPHACCFLLSPDEA